MAGIDLLDVGDARVDATPVRSRGALAALLVLLALCVAPAQAEWVSSAKSQARLIDGGLIDGVRYVGVQIRLSGAAVTYWRDPGEAGVAPTFDFAGSRNLARAEPLYPQPSRIDEGGIQAFGYQHEVLFPIRVAARDKVLPVVLDLSFDYAVCEAICLPVHAQMHLDLPPAPQADAASGILFAEALKAIPRHLDAAEVPAFSQIIPGPVGVGKRFWLLRFIGAEAKDIFVESPSGFYIETRPGGAENAFTLVLLENPSQKPLPDAPVRVTVTGPSPTEFEIDLPRGGR